MGWRDKVAQDEPVPSKSGWRKKVVAPEPVPEPAPDEGPAAFSPASASGTALGL